MFNNNLDVEAYEQQYAELQQLREVPFSAERVYAVEVSAAEKEKAVEIYNTIRAEFPAAPFELKEEAGVYGIFIDGAESLLRVSI